MDACYPRKTGEKAGVEVAGGRASQRLTGTGGEPRDCESTDVQSTSCFTSKGTQAKDPPHPSHPLDADKISIFQIPDRTFRHRSTECMCTAGFLCDSLQVVAKVDTDRRWSVQLARGRCCFCCRLADTVEWALTANKDSYRTMDCGREAEFCRVNPVGVCVLYLSFCRNVLGSVIPFHTK